MPAAPPEPACPEPPVAPAQPTPPKSLPAPDHLRHQPSRRSPQYSRRPAPPFLPASAPPSPSASATCPSTRVLPPSSAIPPDSARRSCLTGSAAATPLGPHRRPRSANQAFGKPLLSSDPDSPQTAPQSFRSRSWFNSFFPACHILSIRLVMVMTNPSQSL